MPFVVDLVTGSIYGFAWIFAGLAVMIFVPRALSQKNLSVGTIRFTRVLGVLLAIPGLIYLVVVMMMFVQTFVIHSN